MEKTKRGATETNPPAQLSEDRSMGYSEIVEMTLQPTDRNVSCGSRPLKDWASVLSPADFSTQAGTDNLLIWELWQRSDVLTIEQLSDQKTEFTI